MRKILTIGAIFMAIAGCQTTASMIQEPGRTSFYAYCIENGLHVTSCACMEDKAVSDTGITSLDGLDGDDPKVVQFIKALQDAIVECKKATEESLLGE